METEDCRHLEFVNKTYTYKLTKGEPQDSEPAKAIVLQTDIAHPKGALKLSTEILNK
jgi:hypothetical protein